MKIAVLDDYQSVAAKLADWTQIPGQPEIKFFHDHISDFDALIKRLQPFDVLCVMRERTPLTAAVLDRLPNLKLICSTGSRNAAIDRIAAQARGIPILNTGYDSTPTIELSWALLMAVARRITTQNASLRAGGWQTEIGSDLHGKTLAILGLGRIGSKMAKIAQVFGMDVIAWSQNLTPEKAAELGARYVSKEELFRQADFLTIHLILSDRSRGIVGDGELNLMKSTSYLINTSRGPIVKEAALINALENHQIAGAGLDVFDVEPLPPKHPYRSLPNVTATPHLGFVAQNIYETFYQDTVKNICAWLKDPNGTAA